MCIFDGVGTAGEWVGGIGTVAAFGLTAWSLLRTNKQAAADRRETELAQARLITTDVEPRGNHVEVVVHNHSAQPVFAVKVVGLRIGPDNPDTLLHGDADWARIDPFSQTTAYIAASRPGPRDGTPGTAFRFESGVHTISADVEFVDWTGRSWIRNSNHEPEQGRRVPTHLPDHASTRQAIHPSPTLFD